MLTHVGDQILFLNKMDLLADKVTRSPLELYLPDYEGSSNYEGAVSYFRRTFVRVCNTVAGKSLYTHITCATDTRQVKCEYFTGILFNASFQKLTWVLGPVVLKAMLDILIKGRLRDIGFL